MRTGPAEQDDTDNPADSAASEAHINRVNRNRVPKKRLTDHIQQVRERRAPREPHTELPWSTIDYHKWKRERCRAREIERRIEHRVRGGSWAEGVVPNPVR